MPPMPPSLPTEVPLPMVASEKELLAATPPGEHPLPTPVPVPVVEPEPAQAAQRATGKQPKKGKHGGKRRPDNTEGTRFTVTVAPSVFEDLRVYAFTERTSMSAVVEAALRTFLRRRKGKELLTTEERDALDEAVREGVPT